MKSVDVLLKVLPLSKGTNLVVRENVVLIVHSKKTIY